MEVTALRNTVDIDECSPAVPAGTNGEVFGEAFVDDDGATWYPVDFDNGSHGNYRAEHLGTLKDFQRILLTVRGKRTRGDELSDAEREVWNSAMGYDVNPA